jgi:phage-related holin
MFYLIKLMLIIGICLLLIDFITKWIDCSCDVDTTDVSSNSCYRRYVIFLVSLVLIVLLY